MDNAPKRDFSFYGFLGDYISFKIAMTFLGESTVLPALIAHFTASPILIGLAGASYQIVWLIPQVLLAEYVTRAPRKRPVLLKAAAIGRLGIPLTALLLLLGLGQWPAAFLACFFLLYWTFSATDSLAALAWLDLVARILPLRRRETLFATALIIGSLSGIVVGYATRLTLDGHPFPANFAYLIGYASLWLYLSALSMLLIREPSGAGPVVAVTEAPRPLRLRLQEMVDIFRRDALARLIILARLLTQGGQMAWPFYVRLATERLGLGEGVIGNFTIIITVAQVLGVIGFRLLARRYGPRAVMIVSALPALASPLLAVVASLVPRALGIPLLYGVYACMGIFGVSAMLGYTNAMLEIAPEAQRPTYMALGHTLIGLSALFPLLGGLLLRLTSFPVMFAVACLPPLLGFALSLRVPPLESRPAA